MRIVVVLDATAATAHARASTAVGEILAEILDDIDDGEDVRVALPVMSYLLAIHHGNGTDMRRLAAHPAVELVSTTHDHAGPAGRIAVELAVPGDTAAAAYLALLEDASLLTEYGDALRKSPDADMARTPIDIRDDYGREGR